MSIPSLWVIFFSSSVYNFTRERMIVHDVESVISLCLESYKFSCEVF